MRTKTIISHRMVLNRLHHQLSVNMESARANIPATGLFSHFFPCWPVRCKWTNSWGNLSPISSETSTYEPSPVWLSASQKKENKHIDNWASTSGTLSKTGIHTWCDCCSWARILPSNSKMTVCAKYLSLLSVCFVTTNECGVMRTMGLVRSASFKPLMQRYYLLFMMLGAKIYG